MKIKTSITKIQNDKEIIRGHELENLIQEKSFVEVIYLLFKGNLPTEKETKMLNAMLVASIDHGPGVASALNARISASAQNSTHSALASGILGFGPRHGIAGQGMMEFLYSHVDETDIAGLVSKLKELKVRVPGFGHKVFTDADPRAEALFKLAKNLEIFGKYSKFAHQFKNEINAQSSRPLPINIDGAMGAILCDMGFDARLGQTFFLIGRTPGLLAHIYEEQTQDEGIRRLDESEIEFVNVTAD
ncbi:MAG: citryl-CoA lyase [Candidatus Magasanikbacteria bacterium]|nr:citryl-CoA lyase [Candidatus Magasanikbacteria bacterium]